MQMSALPALRALLAVCGVGLGAAHVSAQDQAGGAPAAERREVGLIPGVPLAPHAA